MEKNKVKTNRKAVVNVLMTLGAFLICIVTAIISITPQTYDIAQGDIAPETITAPEDFVDEVTTQRLREEAQAMVGPSYKIDDDHTQQVIQSFSNDFEMMQQAREQAETLYTSYHTGIQEGIQNSIDEAGRANEVIAAQAEASTAPSDGQGAAATPAPTPTSVPVPTPYEMPAFHPETTDWQTVLTEEQQNEIQALLPAYMNNDDMMTVISWPQSDLNDLDNTVMKEMQQEMHDGIASDDLETAKSSMVSDVARQLRLSISQESTLEKLIDNDLDTNLEFDEAATNAERQAAVENVQPKEYKRGENIVTKGNRITAEQYELLRELGMLSSEGTSSRTYAAVFVYITLMFAMYVVFLATFNKRLLGDTKKVAILSILTAVAYVTTAVAQLVSVHVYPIILFVILGAVLLSPKNAMVYSVFLSLLLMSVTTNGQDLMSRESLVILLSTLVGSFFAVYILKDMRFRSRLLWAGVVSAVPGVVIETILWMLRIINSQQLMFNSAVTAASGLLCGIASIGVLPIIENTFRLTTPTKLLELSSPSHPLLQRLQVEAPGTYHHSVLVANLAESASNAVGGYALLARVGAYFHDVGKLENPLFFKENQRNNFNPHDNFSPWESSAIIKRHTTEGAAMLKKHNMPPELITITREHHGNSLTGYFYAQALETGKKVNENDFRYDSIPPTTKEGAIIMLADVVEAAVRSLDRPEREEIEETVNRLIRERYDDGQLDNAPLNRMDLNKISTAFINIFSGVYHQRIQYPEIKIHGVIDEDNVL